MLKVLERIQNQALRLITGAVKTTPSVALTLTTGNKTIQEPIKKRQYYSNQFEVQSNNITKIKVYKITLNSIPFA
jgi:hypothetical protein